MGQVLLIQETQQDHNAVQELWQSISHIFKTTLSQGAAGVALV